MKQQEKLTKKSIQNYKMNYLTKPLIYIVKYNHYINQWFCKVRYTIASALKRNIKNK